MKSLCPSCRKTFSENDAPVHCPHCSEPLAYDVPTHSTRNSSDKQVLPTRSAQTPTNVELASDHWMEYVPKEVLEHTPHEGTAYFRRVDHSPSSADTFVEEKAKTDLDFSDREREEAHRKLLRSKGLTLDVDSQGFRLSGTGTSSATPSDLSPYDIVRLASEFEGGVVPVEERINCPNCEAVVSPHDKTCQWCSTSLNT